MIAFQNSQKDLEKMLRLEFQSCIRGFHVYKSTWTPFIGETLLCSRETSNLHNQFAVKVVKTDMIVGHLPKKISSTCSIFLRKGGTITCRVNGTRRYSRDFIQGGLEIPFVLIFEIDNDSFICKIQKIFSHCQKQEEEMEVPAKRIKLENKENERNENIADEVNFPVWLSLKDPCITLYSSKQRCTLKGREIE